MSDGIDREFREMTQRERVFELVMSGVPRNLAGLEVGWTLRQCRLEFSDPDFAEMIDGAEELRDDGVEAALYHLAGKGNLGAIQMILFNRRASDWRDVKRIEVHSEHKVNLGEVASVKQALKEMLREGAVGELQPGGVLDVESEEIG